MTFFTRLFSCLLLAVACGGQSHHDETVDAATDAGVIDAGSAEAGPQDAGDGGDGGDGGGYPPRDAGPDASGNPADSPCHVRADCSRWVDSDPYCMNGSCCVAFEDPARCTCATDDECGAGFFCCETRGSPERRTCSAIDFCVGGL